MSDGTAGDGEELVKQSGSKSKAKPKAEAVERGVSCRAERDRLIRQLWSCFREMSNFTEADDFSEEDLELWGCITRHSAIQNRLGN